MTAICYHTSPACMCMQFAKSSSKSVGAEASAFYMRSETQIILSEHIMS